MSLLLSRDFGPLWWATAISTTGDFALRVALPVGVLALTGSVGQVAAVVAAGMLGGALTLPFAGALVDRWDRRRTLVAANALQAPLVLALLTRDPRAVVAVAFLAAALASFVGPAETAILPGLVPPDRRAAASSLLGVAMNTGRLAGPVVGGLIAALPLVAIVDAASFALAAALCCLIRGRHRRHAGVRVPGWAGLREAAANRTVRAILALLAITSVGDGMMSTLFAVYVTGPLHGGARELGWCTSAQAVGGILGGLVAARFARRIPPVPLIAGCYTFFGLVDLAIFNYPRIGSGVAPVVALFVLVGVPVGVHVGAIWALFQSATPDAVRGRAYALIWTGATLTAIAGTAVAGAYADPADVMSLLTVQGVGPLVGAAVFVLLLRSRATPSWRRERA
ncbi:MFS transporter [Hamadaea tsunoensis]|uniref:MFS transporter n=1 Tax=Hamadaea tsunoensis TaxID=53368 RepID=UPI000425A59F|nr:MFS transporter [Hamadaea tsunoensis]